MMNHQHNSPQNLNQSNIEGKSLIGYVGPFTDYLNCTGYGSCYLSLIDTEGQTHYLEADQATYKEALNAFNTLSLEKEEHAYYWVKRDDNGMLLEWHQFKSTLNLKQVCFLFNRSYDYASVLHLFQLTESITMIPLRMFVREVIADQILMKSFVQIPASKQHHHSFPGGLLSHSLEVALLTRQTVQSLAAVSTNEREVAMIAGLLHDIGKTKTLGMKSHTNFGRLIDHEQFTLALLAPHLDKLTKYWAQGSEVLQYLLTWKDSVGICRFVSGNAIKMADRLSTSASIRNMAFKDKPGYFSYSSLFIGAKTHYVSRLN